MAHYIAMLPTYDEAENIRSLLEEVLTQGERWSALVVDDDSPDGTWKIVAEIAEANPRVHLLHRTTDRGRGPAGKEGFRRALDLGADAVLEMDADWSHHPRHMNAMAEAIEAGADLVIGSRRIPGGGETGRGVTRRLITQFASNYIRLTLGLPVRDPTSGFRMLSRKLIEALPWDAINAVGPHTLQQVLLATHARGFKIVEVPILFEERRAGRSTFHLGTMIQSFFAVLRMRLMPGAIDPR